jgi:pimeloyl-ACP methyl ester carboxylesterase
VRRKKSSLKQPRKRRWLHRFLIGCSVTLILSLTVLIIAGVLIYQALNGFTKEFSTLLVQEALPTLLERTPDVQVAAPSVPTWTEDQNYTGTPFAFSPSKPTMIVLLHGATRTPQPGGITGTLQGARAYWGYTFVAGLLGCESLTTLGGKKLTLETWQTETLNNDAAKDHILQSGDKAKSNHYIMLTHRNGSAYLGPQTTEAVQQIYALYQQVSKTLGEEPQLVLVAHSMGGIVSRYLLSNPKLAATSDNAAFLLDDKTRRQADFLRDRTLYLITLSTPHTGSRAADNALTVEKVTALTDKVLKRFELNREEDPQRLAMGFLRAYQDSTQHLRTDTLAALNQPSDVGRQGGLLEPHHARRTDSTLVPIYTLSGRSPAGGFFDNPNVDLGAELTLLDYDSDRLGLKSKLLTDALNMIVSDYMMSNFPGLSQGWGDAPPDLAFLDKVRRYTPFKRDVRIDATQKVPFEGFPTYYLNHAWQGLNANPVAPGSLEVWLEYLLPEHPTTMDELLPVEPGASFETLRDNYIGSKGRYLATPNAPISDGYIDSDGVVALDSGLGLFLGTTESEYFSHEKTWEVDGEKLRGSWYRIFDNRYPQNEAGTFPWEWGNHSFMQYSSDVAQWLRQTIFGAAGPYVGEGSLSTWELE